MRSHRGTTDWGQGRLRYFAVASSVLSGVRADALPLENAPSEVGAVQREVPRMLRFLARRADEREPGAPDVAVAAADLATALEFGTAERGSGSLFEALKRAYRPMKVADGKCWMSTRGSELAGSYPSTRHFHYCRPSRKTCSSCGQSSSSVWGSIVATWWFTRAGPEARAGSHPTRYPGPGDHPSHRDRQPRNGRTRAGCSAWPSRQAPGFGRARGGTLERTRLGVRELQRGGRAAYVTSRNGRAKQGRIELKVPVRLGRRKHQFSATTV